MPKKKGAPDKKFATYLFLEKTSNTSLAKYVESPATTLMTYLVDAHDAIALCRNKFTKKKDGKFNQDSLDSLRIISAALLATIMGHFETFERCLFAGVFEASRNLTHFDLKELFKTLGRDTEVDIHRLGAYRGTPASVGLVLADALTGWHDPEKVNGFFRAFQFPVNVFSNDDVAELQVLWQMRHSIVHTGAWLTLPDSQKVSQLKKWANQPLIFRYTFIQAVCRKLHRLVKNAVARLEGAFRAHLAPDLSPAETSEIDNVFLVKSIKQTWLT